jgi:outer membrane protein assembly factor BamB
VAGSAPALTADGATVYACSANGTVYALSSASGAIQWTAEIGPVASASPAIGADGSLYVGSTDGRLYALSPTGAVAWATPLGGTLSTPAIGTDGAVYLTSSNRGVYKMHALVGATGAIKWSATLKWGNISPPAPSIGPDGTLMVSWAEVTYAYAAVPVAAPM